MKEAIKETFQYRETSFEGIVVFSDDFLKSDIHQMRWIAFLKRKKAIEKVELSSVVQLLQILLILIVETMTKRSDCPVRWSHRLKCWQFNKDL